MGIYENIKNAAAAKDITIVQLEKDLGLPRSSISKYDRNKPSAENIFKIANALGVTSEYLLTGEMTEGYYLDTETARIAQEIVESKEMALLFDASRDASPEDLQTTYQMLLALKRKERHEDDEP